MDELSLLLTIADKAGGVLFLLLFVVSLVRGWIVPGWYYREAVRQRDAWMDAALSSTTLADRTSKLATRLTEDGRSVP